MNIRKLLPLTLATCIDIKMAQSNKDIWSQNVDRFVSFKNQSWTTHLNEDPESMIHRPNKVSRQVRSGHFVPVTPGI